MDEKLNIEKITKLFSKLYNPKIDVEFTDDEIDKINSAIHNNDASSVVHVFESKAYMQQDVLKEMINSKVEDLWQFIMTLSYEKWEQGMSRSQYLEQLTEYEKIAIQFGNFNFQVENGGLLQWHDNNYSEDYQELYDFLTKSDFKYKDKFISILENFDYIRNAIEKLDINSDWYDQDCETRWNQLDFYDKQYYSISESWKDYFENYLMEKIPDEYISIISQLDINKTSI